MTFFQPFGRYRREALPRPLLSLHSIFATRREIFGPHELREDRIKAGSDLADDLSAEARRALREHGESE